MENIKLRTILRPEWSAEGLRNLCRLIKKLYGEEITIVEVGSFIGESSVIFAQEFPKGKIYCIDPWLSGYDEKDGASDFNYDEVEKEFDYRIKDYPNIIKTKGKSLDFKIECDIVYIDGCHKYECVKEDILHWIPFTKKAVCGHDFQPKSTDSISPHTAGIRIAVEEIFTNPDSVFSDGSWIKQINK